MGFMLCDKVGKLTDVNLDNYIGEWKMDGERIQAEKTGNKVCLFNRRGREKSSIYVEVIDSLKELDFDFIVDGEVVTRSCMFNDLQHRSNCSPTPDRLRNYPVKMIIFDIIFLDGNNLKHLPLLKRKEYLERFRGLANVEVIDWFEGDGIKELWENVVKNDWEGIILKVKNSLYENRRSKNWLKLKNWSETIIEFCYYEENNSGVKLSSENAFYEVQVQEDDSNRVEKIKEEIDKGNKVKVIVQYLEETKLGKLRFPSCKEVLI